MEELSMEHVLSEREVESLFTEGHREDPPQKDTSQEKDLKETTEVKAEDLFGIETEPESVGSTDNIQDDKEDTQDSEPDSTSPNSQKNRYSSFAASLKEESILRDLDEDYINSISSAEDLIEAMNRQVLSMLDQKQKRINEALEADLEPSEVRKYEQTLEYLDSITEDSLKDESDKGLALRHKLIYNDYLNRGFSPERASKAAERSIKAGTDLEDSIEALSSNKEFFNSRYTTMLEEAKRLQEQEAQKVRERAESLKSSIMNMEDFEGIKLDKVTRQKVYDNITKPSYKDQDGNYYTALQRYEKEHGDEFLTKLGVIFTLTDGFKSLDKLVSRKVNKEVKKSIKMLDEVLSRPSGSMSGGLSMMNDLSSANRGTKKTDKKILLEGEY